MTLQIPTPVLERICDFYDLGELISVTDIGGDVNFNLRLETSKGDYVRQRFGRRLTPKKRELLNLEFQVLGGLGKMEFPYLVPAPVLNQEGRIIDAQLDGHYWVYPFLEGCPLPPEENGVKEIATALAVYHQFVSRIALPSGEIEPFWNPSWLSQEYHKMGEVFLQSELDQVMKRYLCFFKGVFHRVSGNNYSENLLPTHGDFSRDNLLFNAKGNVTGIIDFDDVQLAPRIRDIANAVLYSCYDEDEFSPSACNEFLERYECLEKLTTIERRLIVPAILREFCSIFSWHYSVDKKNPEERINGIESVYRKSKSLLEIT